MDRPSLLSLLGLGAIHEHISYKSDATARFDRIFAFQAQLSNRERYMPNASCNSVQGFYHSGVTESHRLLLRNMKRYRILLGISQAELAERAGMSVGYIGEVEIGRKFPSPEKLEAIARVLGLRPFRLLMGPDDVTDAMGPDAVYETAEKLKKRLSEEIDEFVREADPNKPKAPPVFYDERGKRIRGR
jgi:transcriptional regulator with XRE-family HTH domain